MVDESLQRGITPEFQRELTGGPLLPILERVRKDDTLTLAVRSATSTSTTAADGCSASTGTAGRAASAPSST